MTSRTAKTQLAKLSDAYINATATLDAAKRHGDDVSGIMGHRSMLRECLGRMGMSADEINAL
jgi:hypothetical protein